MANTVKNLKHMMGDSKTRAIVVFTAIFLVVGVVIGIFELRSRVNGPATQAALKGVPQNIRSIPGGFDTPETVEYKRLQEKQNISQAQQALREGKSAIPTIVESTDVGSGQNGDWQTGLGFTSLNRVEEGSQFNPKKVDLAVSNNGTDNGAAVYNKEGCLVGYTGKDKKVCDLNGNVIGTVSPDGKIQLVSKPSFAQLGKPIYDANGRLIGYADDNGAIRNAEGKIIGAVNADGTVRDAAGKVLGKTGLGGTLSYGKPIYDADGHLIGYAGPDGLIRDASGKVVGTVGADGIARDLSGQIISKTAGLSGNKAAEAKTATGKGTPVYDANGRIIGYANANGVVRAADGRVIGSVGPDGTVRDALGIPLAGPGAGGGGVGISPAENAEQNPAVPGIGPGQTQNQADNSLQAIAQRQAEQMSAVQLEQAKQQLQAGMTTQANQLMNTAWGAPMQQYVEAAKTEETGQTSGGLGGGSGAAGASGSAKVMFKAGTILFAVLDTAVNSDEASSPVMATIVSGKLKGSKLMGGLTNQGERVKLSFSLLNMPTVSRSIKIDAVAIDPNTARTALSSYTDNHYFLRYGSLFASSFIEGYGKAVETSGQQLVSSGLQTNIVNPDLSPKDKMFVALGKIGQKWSTAAGRLFNTPPTVQVYAGTAIGVLIMTDLLEQTE